jgi:hypothetical protein
MLVAYVVNENKFEDSFNYFNYILTYNIFTFPLLICKST